MKILLDENLPKKLKFDFEPEIETKTVQEMNWQGKKNGELLELLITNDFSGLITIDKNLKHQQNLNNFDFFLIILDTPNNKHQTLQPLIPKLKQELRENPNKKIYEIK